MEQVLVELETVSPGFRAFIKQLLQLLFLLLLHSSTNRVETDVENLEKLVELDAFGYFYATLYLNSIVMQEQTFKRLAFFDYLTNGGAAFVCDSIIA